MQLPPEARRLVMPAASSRDGRGQGVGGKFGEGAAVDDFMDVFSLNVLEIDHGRGQVTVSEPFLENADTDAVFEATGSIGMAKLVKKPAATVRTLRALVAMPGLTLTAI